MWQPLVSSRGRTSNVSRGDLIGCVAWAKQVNPARAVRLQRLLDGALTHSSVEPAQLE